MTSPADPDVIHVVYACDPGRFRGGVSKMVYELARAQNRHGMRAEIWTIGTGSDAQIRRFPGIQRFGVMRSQALADTLAETARRANPVIHAHNTFHPLNRQVAQVAAKTGARVVFNPHGALDPVLLAGARARALKKRVYIALFERPILNAATGVIALTPQERAQLIGIGVTAPIHVVPNGIEIAGTQARQEDGDLLGFVGRITAKKGIHHMLEALALLRQAGRACRMVIAGDRGQFPDYVARLDALIADRDLGAAVTWAGFIDETQKARLLSEISIFLHASDSEGMPMAVLEAMAAGCAVVVTPGCYMSDAARAGALYEVDQNAKALAAACGALLDNPAARAALGNSGRAYAEDAHSWAAIVRRFAAIYAGAPGQDHRDQARAIGG